MRTVRGENVVLLLAQQPGKNDVAVRRGEGDEFSRQLHQWPGQDVGGDDIERYTQTQRATAPAGTDDEPDPVRHPIVTCGFTGKSYGLSIDVDRDRLTAPRRDHGHGEDAGSRADVGDTPDRVSPTGQSVDRDKAPARAFMVSRSERRSRIDDETGSVFREAAVMPAENEKPADPYRG